MSDPDYDALRKACDRLASRAWDAAPDDEARDAVADDRGAYLRLLDLAQRAEAAEAAVERVRALAEGWQAQGASVSQQCAEMVLDKLDRKED